MCRSSFNTLDFTKVPVTAGVYSAKNEKVVNPKKIYTKEELKEGHSFQELNWNGIDPILLSDVNGCIFAALVGRPDHQQYKAACNDVFDTMTQEGIDAGFKERMADHKRGCFSAVNVGVMHGNGTLRPTVLDNGIHTEMVDRLVANPAVQQIAGFASASFAAFAPNVYGYYKKHLDYMFRKTPELPRLFPASIDVYTSAAFNFGPNVWTFKHRDVLNCPFGWCAVQALGRFNSKKGGHLILWEARLIIEFPSGSLILLPSATITHSNLPVSKGDVCASFTQFAAGGLFRYIDYGLHTAKRLQEEDPDLWEEVQREREGKWEAGCKLLSTIDSLQLRHVAKAETIV